jgi:hypothetical protein
MTLDIKWTPLLKTICAKNGNKVSGQNKLQLFSVRRFRRICLQFVCSDMNFYL